ncbi:YbaK/EbsC family protein [Geminicoccus roseus]|uniref:YbaK/EbsC family protein n=1 Tax=Geminicoccus roseus TaxID=404900 RepID=UPI0005512667|nr:YbaK/EbsC family protein [Geminicoccus roseus]
MNDEASPVERVRQLLGPDHPVIEFDASTATSAEAAQAIGCDVAQIAKSLIFKSRSGRPVLVVASGANRVDEKKVGAILGEKVGRADPDFVLAATGYPVGGVAPVGHLQAVVVLLDADLQGFAEIWAAAGAPNAVFRLTPAGLARLTGGRFAEVARR